jgi:hypothetical protein
MWQDVETVFHYTTCHVYLPTRSETVLSVLITGRIRQGFTELSFSYDSSTQQCRQYHYITQGVAVMWQEVVTVFHWFTYHFYPDAFTHYISSLVPPCTEVEWQAVLLCINKSRPDVFTCYMRYILICSFVNTIVCSGDDSIVHNFYAYFRPSSAEVMRNSIVVYW